MEDRRRRYIEKTSVTPFVMTRIRELSAQGLLQREIAVELHKPLSTVALIQRRENIPHLSRSEGCVRSRKLMKHGV